MDVVYVVLRMLLPTIEIDNAGSAACCDLPICGSRPSVNINLIQNRRDVRSKMNGSAEPKTTRRQEQWNQRGPGGHQQKFPSPTYPSSLSSFRVFDGPKGFGSNNKKKKSSSPKAGSSRVSPGLISSCSRNRHVAPYRVNLTEEVSYDRAEAVEDVSGKLGFLYVECYDTGWHRMVRGKHEKTAEGSEEDLDDQRRGGKGGGRGEIAAFGKLETPAEQSRTRHGTEHTHTTTHTHIARHETSRPTCMYVC